MRLEPFPLGAESVRCVWWGELGKGKTLGAVRQVVLFHERFPSLPIYSNIPLFDIPYRKFDSAALLFDLKEECALLLDEMWTMADSHNCLSLLNDVLTMFMLRSRKKRWRVFYTEQHWRQIDLRIRFITDRWVEPEIRHGFILWENVKSKENVLIPPPQRSDATDYHKFYDHQADPFTLDVAELRARWLKFRKSRMG